MTALSHCVIYQVIMQQEGLHQKPSRCQDHVLWLSSFPNCKEYMCCLYKLPSLRYSVIATENGLGHWELAPVCYSFDFPLCISWRPHLIRPCLILLFQVSPITTRVLYARWCSITLLNEWMPSLFCSQLPWELLQVLCSQDSLKQLTQNAEFHL